MTCKKLFSFLLPCIVMFSCNRNQESANDTTGIQKEQTPDGYNQPGQIPVNAYADSAAPATPGKTIVPVDWDKKIIKTATLKFEVSDFTSYASEVYRDVKQYGGYIAAEDQAQSGEKQETTITIKIPVDQFEPMVNQLNTKEVKVIERKINTDDVGGQLIDTRSRLEARKAMHAKYLEFFKEAKNMEEVLKVQNDINNLQETMESAAGRINYLNQQAAMSTIVLTFYQPLTGVPAKETSSFFTKLTDAFKTGASWIAGLLIGLATIWPLLLVVIAGIFLFKRFSAGKSTQPNA